MVLYPQGVERGGLLGLPFVPGNKKRSPLGTSSALGNTFLIISMPHLFLIVNVAFRAISAHFGSTFVMLVRQYNNIINLNYNSTPFTAKFTFCGGNEKDAPRRERPVAISLIIL